MSQIETRNIPTREAINPDILWSKYSVIQHIIFWILALAAWKALYWAGGKYEHLTLQIWHYLTRFRFYFFTGNPQQTLLVGLITGIVVLGIILGLDYLIAKIKGDPPIRHILRNHSLLPRTGKQQFFAFIVSVNAGIFEELFFRGGIFTLILLLTHSTVSAVLFTSALFAVLHEPIQGWYSTLLIFFVGITLNLLMLITGDFYSAMACHIVINLGNLFLIPALFEDDLEKFLLEDALEN